MKNFALLTIFVLLWSAALPGDVGDSGLQGLSEPLLDIDAVSREFTLFAAQSSSSPIDAVSREFSLYAKEGAFPAGDAIAREFSLYVSTAPTVSTDAVSREFSIYVETAPTVATDAVSREFSIHVPSVDLAVTACSGPASQNAGQPMLVSWTVMNEGLEEAVGTWVDRVFLSNDNAVGGDTELASFEFAGPLAPGTNYDRSESVTVPHSFAGEFWLIIITDAADALPEPGGESNNVAICNSIMVSDTEAPETTILPGPADGGYLYANDVTFQWSGTDNVTPVADLLYSYCFASTDVGCTPSLTDFALTTSAGFAELTAAESPYVFNVVARDLAGNIDPTAASRTFSVDTLLPNLVVTNVVAPNSAQADQVIMVTWTVLNTGADAADGEWVDQIYISYDDQFDNGDDILLGTIPYSAGVPASSTYTRVAQLVLPNSPGIRWIIVVTDATDTLVEAGGQADNITVDDQPINVQPAPSVDLVVSTIDPPVSGVLSGTSVQITYTVTNQGSLATQVTSWLDSVLLSSDPNLSWNPSASDQIICTQPFPERFFANPSYLPAGESYSQTVTLTLLEDQPGTWYVYAIADRNACHGAGLVPESNNANNLLRSDAFSVTLAPQPDLRILAPDIDFEIIAFSNDLFTVAWIDRNVGAGASNQGEWVDAVYLSPNADPVINGNDLLLGTVPRIGAVLPPGGSEPRSLTTRLPPEMEGDRFVKIVVDADDDISEFGFEGNNIAVSTATVDVVLSPPPDLYPIVFTAPPAAVPGHAIEVSWTAENIGSPPVTQLLWNDAVYLSADTAFDPSNDTLLGVFAHTDADIAGTQPEYTDIRSVTVPNDAAVGTHYLLIVLDEGQTVFEHAGEANNVLSAPLLVQFIPTDLVVEVGFDGQHPAPTAGAAGQLLDLSWRVTNDGEGVTPVSAWADSVYFSTDAEFNTGDRLLVSIAQSVALEPGSSYVVEQAAAAPLVSPGSYYLLFITDAQDHVYEQAPGEDNNIFTSPFVVTSVGADLVVTGVQAPDVALSGQPISVSWTVCNNGALPTLGEAWNDRVYISTDDQVDANDVILGTVAHNGVLAAVQCYAAAGSFNLPINAAGPYRIIVRTDALGAVFELSDGNNASVAPAPIEVATFAPDLVVTSLDAAGAIQSDEPLHVEWTVQNVGRASTDISVWVDRVYLSQDDQFDNLDLLLGARTRVQALASGASYDVASDFVVPISLVGPFHMIVSTDADFQLYEQNEGNNSAATSMVVNVAQADAANLIVENVVADDQAVSGQAIGVAWSVHNIGIGPTNAASFRDAVYLSLDEILDIPGDRFIGNYFHTATIGAGSTVNVTGRFDIPLGVNGSYYVFVLSDSGDDVFEAGLEGDNDSHDSAASIIVAPLPADLVVSSATPPGPSVLGTMAEFTWQITNNGNQIVTGSWFDSIYLSADIAWDASDAFVGRFQTSPPGNMLSPGQSVSNTVPAQVPATTPGPHHLIVRADVFNQIPETNESNNVGASVGAFEVSAIPLELGVPLQDTLANGQSKFYALETPAGETVRITLDHSGNSAWTELYVRFGALATAGQFDFAFSAPALPDQEVLIPSTLSGTYYILARTTTGATSPSMVLSAQVIPFGISAVSPQIVGAGQLTLRLSGSRWTNDTNFRLRNISTGQEFVALDSAVTDPASGRAFFELAGAELGRYDVIATDEATGTTAVLSNAVVVEEPSALIVSSDVIGIDNIRKGTSGGGIVRITNNSNVNIPVLAVDFGILYRPGLSMSVFPNSVDSNPLLTLNGGSSGIGDFVSGEAFWEDVAAGGSVAVPITVRVANSYAADAASVFAAGRGYSRDEFAREVLLGDLYRELLYVRTLSEIPTLTEEEFAFLSGMFLDQFYTDFINNGSRGRATDRARVSEPVADCKERCDGLRDICNDVCDALSECALFFPGCSKPAAACVLLCPRLEAGCKECCDNPCLALCDTSGRPECAPTCQSYTIPSGSNHPRLVCVGRAVFVTFPCMIVSPGFPVPMPIPNNVCGGFWTCVTDCHGDKDFSTPAAGDPNEKEGRLAFGPERWVAGGDEMPYRLLFENVPSATAPAAEVRIVDQLVPSLSIGSLRLGDIHFGQNTIDVPENRISYRTTLDVTATSGVLVEVTAGVNAATREAFWNFRSLDPSTGEAPTSGAVGFLPPEDGTGRGQGWVEYTIKPAPGVTHGTVITNAASIVFDVNESIATNEVFNTIDAADPMSAVNPLPVTTPSSTIALAWTGNDVGSGLTGFTVYGRIDGMTYIPAVGLTDQQVGMFEGARGGGVYDFYSIAHDNAGNVEAPPAAPDATTTIATQVPFVPSVAEVTAVTMRLTSLGLANVDRIEHAIIEEATGMYIGASGRLEDQPFWIPLSAWTDFQVRALSPSTEYSLRTKARDASGETAFGPATVVTTSVQGDVNGDGLVNPVDLDLVSEALGTQYGDADFYAQADLNGDDRVTYADLGLVRLHQGDFDRDGDVDSADLASFLDCFEGPVGLPSSATCDSGDVDQDGDIDLRDFAAFQFAFTGS